VQFSYLPVLRAQLALNRRAPELALTALEMASPHELGLPRSTVSALFGALYPVYVRGTVYLALGRGPDAAAEFQKVLDHRQIIASDPIGALALLHRGRADALAGDRGRARSAYEAFLNAWRDADPDVPVLREAQAALARLQ
jgi:eukaryotic-like serine/threonine-protein kinase